MYGQLKYLFYLACIPFLFCTKTMAQGQASKPVWKRDTLVADNVFRKYNNWLSAGGGIAKNSQFGGQQFTGGIDYNFHIQKEYFQFGLFVTGDQFGEYNNYQFHLCYGKRTEDGNLNFAYFGGLSFSTFYERQGNGYDQNPIKDVGLYFNTELIKKFTYDTGGGISAFADINSHRLILGAKLDLFFSGAYKGKKDSFY